MKSGGAAFGGGRAGVEYTDDGVAITLRSLAIAARDGNTALCEQLIHAGLKVNVSVRLDAGKAPVTPLSCAVISGHIETCRTLLDCGADPNFDRGIALTHAIDYNRMEICQVLLGRGALSHGQQHVMHLVRKNVDVKLLCIFLEYIPPKFIDAYTETPLIVAAYRGNEELCQALLEHGVSANTVVRDLTIYQGIRTFIAPRLPALSAAVKYPKTCELLLRCGANVHQVGGRGGHTPLHVAVSFGQLKTCELLLRHGAITTIPDFDGRTALNYLGDNGRHIGMGVPHTESSMEVELDIAKLLLSHGANADDLVNEKSGLLMLKTLVAKRRFSLFAFILQNLSNPASIPVEGFYYDRRYGEASLPTINLIKRLILRECNRRRGRRDVVILWRAAAEYAARKRVDRAPMLELPVDVACNIQSLADAAKQGQTSLCARLIEAGVDVNAEWAEGGVRRSPLWLAVFYEHETTCEYLLNHGAHVNSERVKAQPESDSEEEVEFESGYIPTAEEVAELEDQRAAAAAEPSINIYASYYNSDEPLKYAVYKGNALLCQLLLSRGAVVGHGYAAAIAVQNHLPLMEVFLHHLEGALRGSFLREAMIGAATEGHYDLCKLLLERGAMVNAEFRCHVAPLSSAVKHLRVCQLLLEHGADIAQISGPKRRTALHCAVAAGHYDTCQLFLGRGANVHDADKDGKTALHCITECREASRAAEEAIMRLLLHHGIIGSMPEHSVHSVLFALVEKSKLNLCTMLLKYTNELDAFFSMVKLHYYSGGVTCQISYPAFQAIKSIVNQEQCWRRRRTLTLWYNAACVASGRGGSSQLAAHPSDPSLDD